ncbi:hypothetical protein PENTCL1PPCAC_6092, partial [Pristionchus entomophagus]
EDETEESDIESSDQLLSMDEDYGTQKEPSAPLSIYVKHAQYLQEANTPYGRRGENLTLTPENYDEHGSDNYRQIYYGDWFPS